MTFRFQGRHVFLTYARCDKGHLEILEALRLIDDIIAYTGSTELHQDGHPHVHMLLRFAKKIHHRNVHRWDIEDRHPNVIVPNAILSTRDYIKKDGNYVEHGWDDKPKPYAKCLADAGSKEEFLAEIRTHHTRDYVLQYDRIISMADAHWQIPCAVYTPEFTQFNPPESLNGWVNSSLVSSPLSRLERLGPPLRGPAFSLQL